MQSITLFATSLVLFIPGYLISIALVMMQSSITSLLATLVWLVLMLIGIAMFVFMVISAIKAYNGEVYKIPVIGNLADKWSN